MSQSLSPTDLLSFVHETQTDTAAITVRVIKSDDDTITINIAAYHHEDAGYWEPHSLQVGFNVSDPSQPFMERVDTINGPLYSRR